MPSAFTHIFVAGVLSKAVYADEKVPLRFWVLIAVCSILPDIDIVGFYLGIKYSHVLGHRGFFHSLTFALFVATAVVVLAFPAMTRFSKKWWALLVLFFAVTASHGILDSMTDKGLGVGFFIPFENSRYHMPWRPVFASPMRIEKFFSSSGLQVLLNEVLWIWLPMIGIYVIAKAVRNKKAAGSAGKE